MGVVQVVRFRIKKSESVAPSRVRIFVPSRVALAYEGIKTQLGVRLTRILLRCSFIWFVLGPLY